MSAVHITTICLGNICRSPMAEAVLARSFADQPDVVIDSAGTAGWHSGDDADPRARATLAEHGYDLNHSAKRFDPAALRAADHILLAMDSSNYRDVEASLGRGGADGRLYMFRQFDPNLSGITPPSNKLDVPDPYYGSQRGFEQVLTMIERATQGLVVAVASGDFPGDHG